MNNGNSFNFGGVNWTPGLSWDTTEFENSGTITVVPEPSVVWLAVLGTGLVLRRRR